MKKKLVESTVEKKLKELHKTGKVDSGFMNFIFKPVREKFGGRVKFMATGSAPIAADILDFMKVTLSCMILEGYG